MKISSEEYKHKGHTYLKEGRYNEAIAQYNEAIKLDSSQPVYYSYRSQCNFMLQIYEDAILDAQHAVRLDPTNYRFRIREANAWSGLEYYEQSISIIEELLTISTLTKDERDLLKSALDNNRSLLRNQNGEFDFENIKLKLKSSKTINTTSLQVADYIGPVEIRESNVKNGGRGLFTTRKINKGENLLVTKAVAYHRGNISKIENKNVYDYNESMDEKSKVMVVNLIQLMCYISKSKLFAHRILNLYSSLHQISDIYPASAELYSYKGYDRVKNNAKPTCLLERLLGIHNFNTDVANPDIECVPSIAYHRTLSLTPWNISVGIWCLLSFINHSCIYNVDTIYIRDICILRAICDIPAGGEILRTYQTRLDSNTLEENQIMLYKTWKFQCSCILCESESILMRDPIIPDAIELMNYIRKFSKKYSPSSQVNLNSPPAEEYKNLASKTLKMAKKLKLNTKKFCIPVGLAILFLMKMCPQSEKDYFEFAENAEAYLCDYEFDFQISFWRNFYNYIYFTHAPRTSRTLRVIKNCFNICKLAYNPDPNAIDANPHTDMLL